ncbi:uncharacterized protein LOC122390026 [Amphibalanus amphitrite]|uniref:uncharacterized protein LOC122390026 n=1 Tax=Amphibalanus amphitrite TaxID=1232801 RepID=UPI001C91F43E|nr:uncharacterized protein LOC122390026 [Amphibalanus amphitrite]
MKTLVCSIGITLVAVGLSALVSAQAPAADPKLEEVIAKLPTPGSGQVFVRTIPADVLRDYPGRCFSYNNYEFYNVNDTWNINGVCAMAECMALPINQDGQLGLFEQVFDCGPSVVKTVKECTYTREADLTKKFPDCCPTFTCTDGFDARDLLRPAVRSAGEGAAAADAEQPADAPAQ